MRKNIVTSTSAVGRSQQKSNLNCGKKSHFNCVTHLQGSIFHRRIFLSELKNRQEDAKCEGNPTKIKKSVELSSTAFAKSNLKKYFYRTYCTI